MFFLIIRLGSWALGGRPQGPFPVHHTSGTYHQGVVAGDVDCDCPLLFSTVKLPFTCSYSLKRKYLHILLGILLQQRRIASPPFVKSYNHLSIISMISWIFILFFGCRL